MNSYKKPMSEEPNTNYQKVTDRIVEELQAIVGERYVIYGDADALEAYSHDETGGKQWAHPPEVAVRPETTEQIAAIMKLANRERIPVTPRGAGSGLSGGAVPIYGGIVLLSDRMNRILEIDTDNLMITVEPAVITSEINEQVEPLRLFYAGYPMSMETCSIGGNVAENAGGGKAIKYGVTSRYVLGLEVVTPTGDIVQLGGKLIKDVTGYNLVQLMVGSEGTLGIFTKITLKLLPLPQAQVDLLCLFSSPEQAIGAVTTIITACGIIPTAVEFIDRQSFEASCKYLNETLPYQDAGAMLLITLDGHSPDQVQNDYEAVGEKCMELGATEVYVADNPTTSERIWRIRRNIPEAYNLITQRQSGEDIVVPPASIPQLVAKIRRLAEKYDVLIPTYGHAGDGNLHSRLVSKPEWSDEYWNELLPRLQTELYQLTAQLGGRISGEHGIGHKRKKYLAHVVSQEYITMLRAIKRALDPNNILNPGKIFDMEPSSTESIT
ncbi:MAG: FAD-binding protein [Sedimentisphaerales bacterium]|nr:FAD-binding protein [Sedimentisphaerales bacterium]